MKKLLDRFYPHSYALVVFITIFIVMSPLIFFTVYNPDNGFFLYYQSFLKKNIFDLFKIVPLWWFSDVIAGWVLKFCEIYGFIYCKIFSICIYSLCGMITTYTIALKYRIKPLFIICICSLPLFLHLNHGTMNYYSISMLFLIIFSYFYFKALQNKDVIWFQILAAIFLLCAILSKVTIVITFIIPIFSIGISFLLDKKNWRKHIFLPIKVMGISGIIILIFYSIIWHFYKIYILFYLKNSLSQTHTLRIVLVKYIKEFFDIKICISIIFLFFFTYLFKKLFDFKNKKKESSFIIFISIFFVIAVNKFILNLINKVFKFEFDFKINSIEMSIFIILLLIIISIYLFFNKNNQVKNCLEANILMMSISLVFINGLFTNSGAWKSFVGIWILAGLVNVFFDEYIENRKGNYNAKVLQNCHRIFWILILLIGMYRSYAVFLFSPLKQHSFGRMKYIISTKNEVTPIELILEKINLYSKKEDEIIIYPGMGIIYWASNRIPKNPYLYYHFHRKNYSEKIRFDQKAPPKIIVKNKSSLELYDIQNYYFRYSPGIEYFEKRMKENWNLLLIWENENFEIYRPEIKKG